MTVEKKDIDWGSLGFGYMKTDYSYEAHWKDGEWDEGGLTTDHTLHVSECGGIFHYCQEVFEGLKAYTAEDGSIVCFRPDMNAERMYNSAQRLEMPPFPKDKFVEAVKQVVSANAAWVPPFGSGATLYVRPFMIGSGDVIGVAPAPEYTFRILVTPVGPYFKGGLKPVKLRVSEYDRAAPHGTGNIKAGLNYAMSLKPTMEAHREAMRKARAEQAEKMKSILSTEQFMEWSKMQGPHPGARRGPQMMRKAPEGSACREGACCDRPCPREKMKGKK